MNLEQHTHGYAVSYQVDRHACRQSRLGVQNCNISELEVFHVDERLEFGNFWLFSGDHPAHTDLRPIFSKTSRELTYQSFTDMQIGAYRAHLRPLRRQRFPPGLL